MNILEKIKSVLKIDLKLGYLPDKPDDICALFEYDSSPPEHSFNETDFIYGVQVRTRGKNAYNRIVSIANTLNRYFDAEINVIQATPILDIGYDNANPQRQEYTVNFKVRRY